MNREYARPDVKSISGGNQISPVKLETLRGDLDYECYVSRKGVLHRTLKSNRTAKPEKVNLCLLKEEDEIFKKMIGMGG